MLYTDTGFVIRKHEMLGEDQVVTFFLKEHGKVASVAKGIKKTSSRKAGSLDLLNLCKVSLATGKNLDVLTEIRVIDDYSQIKENQEKAFFLFYLDEILSTFIFDGEEKEQIFSLTIDVLDMIKKENITSFQMAIFLNAKSLLFSGFYPEVEKCIVCLNPLEKDDIVMLKTGAAHERCSGGRSVTVNEVKMLRFLRTARIDEYVRINMPFDLQRRLFSLTIELIEYTIGTTIRSKIYLNGQKY